MPVSTDLQVGEWVVVVSDKEYLIEYPGGVGQIAEVKPLQSGYLVRPIGHQVSYGWGYNELELCPPELIPRTSRYERLRQLFA